MRARTRSLALAAATAAVTAASLPLWASTAGAGSEPDESHASTRTVTVGGVACEVQLANYRYGSGVYGSTSVISTNPACRTQQVYVIAEFTSISGDAVSASADDEGPSVDVAGGGARDLVRTIHGVNFIDGTSSSFTLNSK